MSLIINLAHELGKIYKSNIVINKLAIKSKLNIFCKSKNNIVIIFNADN